MRDIYKELVETHGKEKQIIMCMEELAELIQACSKYLRKQDLENITEEIVDSRIMINQIEYILQKEQGSKFYELYKKIVQQKYERITRDLLHKRD